MTLGELLKINEISPLAANALIEGQRPDTLKGVDVMNLTVGEIAKKDKYEKRFIRRFAALNGVHGSNLDEEI